MFKFLKSMFYQSSCKSGGVCSVHPSIIALGELINEEVREISFYLVKLKEFEISNKDISALCIDALSVFMLNTNYSENDYLNILNRLYAAKTDAKEKYLNYCSKFQIPCEVIEGEFKLSQNADIAQLIEYSQGASRKKQKNCDKTKQNLFDLIVIYSKLCAINVIKIKKFETENYDYDFKILRFFSLTNGYSIRNEKLIRRILEFCKISKEIKNKLNEIYENNFGKIESASINSAIKEGYSILVSGDDLNELKDLLNTIEKNYSDKKINVYTHGNLIRAHFYPYFKNNVFLAGHYGIDNAEYDFSKFEGAILITQNFIQKIDSLYKGEIFSNKLISFEKLQKIKNNDYTPLIETALNLKYQENREPEKEEIIEHNLEKVKNLINDFKEKELIVALGGIQNKFYLSDYRNKKVISINCAFEAGLLDEIIENFSQKDIKIALFIINCDLINFDVLLNSLDKNIEIYLSDCSNILINPHAISALKDDFGVITV